LNYKKNKKYYLKAKAAGGTDGGDESNCSSTSSLNSLASDVVYATPATPNGISVNGSNGGRDGIINTQLNSFGRQQQQQQTNDWVSENILSTNNQVKYFESCVFF